MMRYVEAVAVGCWDSFPEQQGEPVVTGERMSDPVGGAAERGEVDTVSVSLDSGERRLRWAVLIDAIEIYRGGRSPGLRAARRHRHRERSWFLSNDTSSPYSFVSICDALGLDPGYVRRLVFRRGSGAGLIRRKLSERGVQGLRRRPSRGRT